MDVSVANVEFLEGRLKRAAEMYFELAREGDALAAFNYGYCLWRGLGVEKNSAEAKSFFSFARDLEGGAAAYNIAVMYLHGDGVSKDFKKAYEYMQLSANQGCIEAQLYLGMAYTHGCMYQPEIIGITLIPFHKYELLDPAAFLVGEVPEEEFEADEERRYSAIKQDAKRAFECFRAAARHKPDYVEELNAKGKFLYARCYVDGVGVDFDRDKSIRLMLLAGKSGSQEAITYIAENGLMEYLNGTKELPKLSEKGKRTR